MIPPKDMQNTLFIFALLKVVGVICTVNFDPTKHPNWKLLDLGTDCGISYTNRIIGGKEASLGQYPWIARIHVSTRFTDNLLPRGAFLCGGVLINNKYVLTAAHCVPSVEMLKIDKVRLGEHNVHTDPDCEDGFCAPPVQDVDVVEVIKHEQYNMPYRYKHDICLLRLQRTVEFNEFVSPICMVYGPLMKTDHADEIMDVAGWGVIDIGTGDQAAILNTLKIPVMNGTACKKAFSGLAEIGDEQLCGGGIIGQDSCGGDSGGPLMKVFAIDRIPRYFIVAVVSFGTKNCAETDKPGVYTRVAYFLDWILDNIKP